MEKHGNPARASDTGGEFTHPSLRREVPSSNLLSVSDATLTPGQQGNCSLSISESGLDLTKASKLSLQSAEPVVRVKAARAEQLPALKQAQAKVSAPEQSSLLLLSPLCYKTDSSTDASLLRTTVVRYQLS